MLNKEGILSRFKIGPSGESKAHRDALPKDVLTSLKEQFSSLAGQDLSGFTCEQERSHQKGAKHDLHIYDASGQLCYEGRRFGGSEGISLWKPGA